MMRKAPAAKRARSPDHAILKLAEVLRIHVVPLLFDDESCEARRRRERVQATCGPFPKAALKPPFDVVAASALHRV
jgi:hypothetical protein